MAQVHPTTMEASAMPSLPAHLSVEDAAARLALSPRWIRRLCQDGRMPGAVQAAGSAYLVPVATVDAMLASRAASPVTAGRPAGALNKPTRPIAAEARLTLAELGAATAVAVAGGVLTRDGAIFPPQVVAFAAGITATKRRRGTYAFGPSAEVEMDSDGATIRLFAG